MDSFFEDPLVGVNQYNTGTSPILTPNPMPNAISQANYRKRYRHLYMKGLYKFPDDTGQHTLRDVFLIFSVKVLQDIYCVYNDAGAIDEKLTKAQFEIFGLMTEKPNFGTNTNYSVIDLYNHAHSIKMRFMRVFSFEIAAGGGTEGTPPNVDNMWDTRSRHTIVIARNLGSEEARGRIEGATFMGPFARKRVSYKAVPGTIREIIPRR